MIANIKEKICLILPLQKGEYSKFFTLLSLYICITFNHDMLHGLKDILLLQNTGNAEILPFLKIYLVGPSMVLVLYIYMKLGKVVDIYRRLNFVLFYFFIIIFLLYFFAIPNLELFKLNTISNFMIFKVPSMRHLWEIIRYWPLSILYVHGEAWSSIVLSVSFWGLANEITTFEQASRMYSFLPSIGSSIGGISAGLTLKSHFIQQKFLNGLMIVCGIISVVFVLYNYSIKNIKASEDPPKDVKKKRKMTFFQSIKILAKSNHLRLIVTIVLGYNIFMHLFENIWKSQVAFLSKSAGPQSLAIIFGNQSMFIGILVFIIGFIAPLIKRRGWRATALVTPTISLLATIFFASFFLLGMFVMKRVVPDISNSEFLSVSVIVGLVSIVVTKSSKYVLFESTKEQAYIPLSTEEKADGKAAIDGFCSRFGKSIGGFILSAPLVGLIHLFGTIYNARIVIFFIMFIIIVFWIRAVYKLDKSIKKKL